MKIIDFNCQGIPLLIFIDFQYNLSILLFDCHQLPLIIGFIDWTCQAVCLKCHLNQQNVCALCPLMYIEHKSGSLVIWLFLFIKCRKGILHRKLSIKSMVVTKNLKGGCLFFCSLSDLHLVRMEKTLFVWKS